MTPDDPRHGAMSGYVAGCRDECCLRAKVSYDKRRRWELHTTGEYRKVPAWRAERRLQALQRLGWSIPALARHLGVKHQVLYSIGRQPTVYRSTFERVAALYEELSMTLPPTETMSQRIAASKARNHAIRRGWAPPLAWDDIDSLGEQPATGWRPVRNRKPDELFAELDHLTSLGISEWQAAQQLGITVNAIEKARERAGKCA